MSRTRRVVAAFALAPLLWAFGDIADALESEGFTLSDSSPKQTKEFPPLVLFNPSGAITSPTLDDCKSLPTHNAIKLRIQLRSDVPVKVTFAVSWDAPEANDVDVYMFDAEGEALASSVSTAEPEVINLAAIPSGDYYLCAVSATGQNTGFTVSGEIKFLKLYEFVPTTPLPPQGTPASTKEPSSTAAPGASGAVVTPEAIESPGGDGPLAAQNLFDLSGKRQAQAPRRGTNVARTTLFILTGVIVGGGIAIVVLRIRRDVAG